MEENGILGIPFLSFFFFIYYKIFVIQEIGKITRNTLPLKLINCTIEKKVYNNFLPEKCARATWREKRQVSRL